MLLIGWYFRKPKEIILAQFTDEHLDGPRRFTQRQRD